MKPDISPVVPLFFPPELAVQMDLDEWGAENQKGVSETGIQSLKRIYFQYQGKESSGVTDRELVGRVMEHAKTVVAHPSRPTRIHLDTFSSTPFGEIALDETLEEFPLIQSAEAPDLPDLIVENTLEKSFSCVAMLDTSSSMSGEKHLLASIAVAVLLLEVTQPDSSVIVFSSKSKVIKDLRTVESIEDTVLKFLRHQAKGFTNIAEGLKAGLMQYERSGTAKRKVGLLLSDGRSTEGKDPKIFAKQFDFLLVMHLHGPGSFLEGSKDLAQAGNGMCLEVENFEELPFRLYEAMRFLVRR